MWYGCGRPGSRDRSNAKWEHVGNGPYWAELSESTASVGTGWIHERNVVRAPCAFGECICIRTECVAGMYYIYKTQKEKAEKGSMDVLGIGLSSPIGRYPSTKPQVRSA